MRAAWLLFALSCGARSELPWPEVDGGAGAGGALPDAGARSCLPNCTVGHACCLGSCNGPTVPTENDCCTCLPGEVSTTTCEQETCGGD